LLKKTQPRRDGSSFGRVVMFFLRWAYREISFPQEMLRPVCLTSAGMATVLLVPFAGNVFGQEAVPNAMTVAEAPAAEYRSPSELKKLPLEMLLDVEITSASRRPEAVADAPSAIDVITGDMINRAGVTNLPDA